MKRNVTAAVCLLSSALMSAPPALAAPLQLEASYTISTNHTAGAASFNDNDTNVTTTGSFAEVSGDYNNSDVGAYNATAYARAEQFVLRSRSGFSFSGYPGADGVAPFYDFNQVTAESVWVERLTVTGVGGTVYMVPIFHLTGTITNNVFGFASYQLSASTDTESKVLAGGTPTDSRTIDTMTMAAAITMTDGVPLDVTFSLATEAFLQGELSAATVDTDFAATADLIAFAFYADPAFKLLLGRDDLTLTGGDGTDFELLIFPEPGTLPLLAMCALVLARRRHKA